MNNIKPFLPELLAPAGSAESAYAAIAGGADAIYFGAERFSARARAKNLTSTDITDCLKQCRARGIKAYGAINTRLRDTELADAVECAWEMLSAGTDALIVADLGLAAHLRETFPEAVLHASTQISGTSAADAATLEELGFSRMVCPRELSLPELRELVCDSPIGIEMFIHGAHCVSVSGQCSMSYVMGGRSGNRGDCAGPCRLPFGAGLGDLVGNKPSSFALSLKDMCLAGHIRDIIGSGVESLKIEGRLKGPEYTYGVVSIYRTLLDEGRDASPDELARLAQYFSRDGFSDGYLRRSYGGMLGTIKDSVIRQDKERFPVPAPNKVPVKGKLRMYCGEPAKLTLTSPNSSVEVTGDILSEAVGTPPSIESLSRSISKLGQTPFSMEELSVDTDGICGISASALNSLRREAAELLCSPAPVVRAVATEPEPTYPGVPEKAHRTAVLASADQLTAQVSEYFDEIFIPFADYLNNEKPLPQNIGVSLPDVLYGGLINDVRAVLSRISSENRKVLVHTLGELSLAASAGVAFVCSHRFVVYNKITAAELRRMGAESVTLSPEVSMRAVKAVSEFVPVSVLTGGRMPLMLCRRCPMSDGGRSCKSGRIGGFDGKTKPTVCRGYLTDRTGAVLPSVGDRYCMTTVYNSVPTWTDLSERSAAKAGMTGMVYTFSTESPAECNEAVRMLRSHIPPKEYRKLK